jgi:taurine transport system ATP-binding protein
MSSRLLIDNVSVQYPGSRQNEFALQDIRVDFPEQGLLVALGPSGCGKTTLLNLMAGFIKPSNGQVLFDNQEISGPSAQRGVVFQDHALFPWMSVLENVAFGLRVQGVSRKLRQQQAQEMLEKVGLSGYANKAIWQLSGGQKQRVGLARALITDPQLLLLDEPFAALDPFTREQMQELLLTIWQQTGKQIFLITHDLEEAIFLASELILLSPSPGRIVSQQALPFSHRYLAGDSARTVKSASDFIQTREQVLTNIFNDRRAVTADLLARSIEKQDADTQILAFPRRAV